ncbi:extracellular solute-binding protein [Agrobacterium tumefaciens]|uniref:ABC transporter substrate-binding protein n=1 Tax=Agrobacterium tumefaciens TaxID=358 RepID=UPI0015718C8D|nr:extracellular solute-binding protein [Agrobacterium tumefaciens]MCZ7497291.1 extracellular solute-binding protein [Rhizobium rhizogenes]NTE56506.1 extracellular solute-binding protein [Agrobacterium tumefaciens]NTE74474.1 extracellular solute-binding protein [Agrobacterium tumefaciens]
MRSEFFGAIAACGVLFASTAHAATISVLVDSNAESVNSMQALTDAYTAAHPDVVFDIETRPGGSEGDNIIKTRLAIGEMADVFNYNAGSLFMNLKPMQTLADLSGLPSQAGIKSVFKPGVTSTDGKVRGVPFGAARGSGIFYSKKIYADLGLKVPLTWQEFMDNNRKIKDAGLVPVVQTYGTTWTSQIIFLGDYYNVQAKEPDFAKKYTENKAKFATDPVALRGFEKLEEIAKSGYLNKDYGAATLNDGLRMIADGKGAHYPLLSHGLRALIKDDPEAAQSIGFFGIPGDDPQHNGMTAWLPPALYVPASSKNVDAAKNFVDWAASVTGCETMIKAIGASGPYMINGCELPKNLPSPVADMIPYFQTEGRTAPALEFLSPVKGPALEQITVEIGSGIRTAKQGAALYDTDVEKQAKQLGLPNW